MRSINKRMSFHIDRIKSPSIPLLLKGEEGVLPFAKGEAEVLPFFKGEIEGIFLNILAQVGLN